MKSLFGSGRVGHVHSYYVLLRTSEALMGSTGDISYCCFHVNVAGDRDSHAISHHSSLEFRSILHSAQVMINSAGIVLRGEHVILPGAVLML